MQMTTDLAEGPTAYDLPLTERGVMRLRQPLREYHLTPETQEGQALVQAVGPALWVWVCSDRDDIRLEVQTEEWVAGRPYHHSIHRWGINLNRWLDSLVVEPEPQRTIEATVQVVEGVTPDE
jgi:hypothetical protein